MILESFLPFMLAWLAGTGVAHLVWKSTNPWSIPLKISLGIGIGLGMTSCLYFLRLVLLPGQEGYLLIQAGTLVIVIFLLTIRKRLFLDVSFRSFSFSRTSLFTGLAAVIVLALALQYSIIRARVSPHGDYDAHAIWNLRARFIYRLGEDWPKGFSPNINRDFHMDYPLLVPMNVTGGWNTLNQEVTRVPAVQAMLFLIGLAGVAFFTLAYLRSGSQGAIAVLVLLSTPYLVQFSTFQTADIPLSYYFMAATSLFLLAIRENSTGLLFLCGLMAGMSAWTKNEGQSFALIAAVTGFILFYKQGWRRYVSLFLGMSLPGLTLLVFKIVLPARNDLLAGNGPVEILQKLADPGRYGIILHYLRSELATLGGWPFSILVILTFYGLILGVTQSARLGQVRLPVWIVAAQFLAYFIIYLITPNVLEWQLMYSMSRLLIHLFPMTLLAFFLVVRTPEEISEARRSVTRTIS
jgi:hypothetical protein